MKAMIFAAGLGTRFKPWTDKHPKALVLVNGKSLLQRNIEYLQRAGISDLIVNVHHFSEQVKAALKIHHAWDSRVSISDESSQVLETGGGLKKAESFFDKEPFVLMNVDILTDLSLGTMIQFHARHRPLATLAVTNRNSSRYFLFNKALELCGWRNRSTGEEKITRTDPPLHEKAFSGIHILEPDIFSLIHQEGKFSMVEVYLDLCRTERILGFDHSGSKLIDVGKPESLVWAEALFP